jgi:DNA-binding transcriptional MerR regulator
MTPDTMPAAARDVLKVSAQVGEVQPRTVSVTFTGIGGNASGIRRIDAAQRLHYTDSAVEKSQEPLPKSLVSTNEVVATEGVHRNTLTRWWKQLGLLPQPKRFRHGRGWHHVWPVSVLERIRTIRRLHAEGWPLRDVRLYLARHPARHEEIERLAQQAFVEWTVVDPPHRADGSMLNRYLHQLAASLDDMPITPEYRQQIVDAARAWFLDTLRVLFKGFEPVLVSDGTAVAVVEKPMIDVIVAGRRLATHRPAVRRGPVLVLELSSLLSSIWAMEGEPIRSRLGPYPWERFHRPLVVREHVVPLEKQGFVVGREEIEYDFTVGEQADGPGVGAPTIEVSETSAHPATSLRYSTLDLLASGEAYEASWRGKRGARTTPNKQKVSKPHARKRDR